MSETENTDLETKNSEGMFSYVSNSSEKQSDNFNKNADITSLNSETNNISETIKPKTNGGLYGFFSQISMTTVLLVILSLALLGFNIFQYLSSATETTTGIFRPLISKIYNFFGYAVTDTAKKTVELSAQGAKLGVDVTAGTVDSTLDMTQELALEKRDEETEQLEKNVESKKNKKKVVVTSDDSQSVFQKNNTSKKAGWCFIGEDKGVRNCIGVDKGDICMSENIYPTRKLCTNPNTRN